MQEIVISARDFLRALKGSPDEVYSKAVTILYASEKNTIKVWRSRVEDIRNTAVQH